MWERDGKVGLAPKGMVRKCDESWTGAWEVWGMRLEWG